MSENTEVQTGSSDVPPQPTPIKQAIAEAQQPAKKVWTRGDVVRHIGVSVVLPSLYPNFEPWEFDLRLKLSQEAEERRQEYIALSAAQMTVKENDQNLDDLCDLLISAPRGFDDLKDDGRGPGSSFKDYVTTSPPDVRAQLDNIVQGAITLYWRKISPQEFRPKV